MAVIYVTDSHMPAPIGLSLYGCVSIARNALALYLLSSHGGGGTNCSRVSLSISRQHHPGPGDPKRNRLKKTWIPVDMLERSSPMRPWHVEQEYIPDAFFIHMKQQTPTVHSSWMDEILIPDYCRLTKMGCDGLSGMSDKTRSPGYAPFTPTINLHPEMKRLQRYHWKYH